MDPASAAILKVQEEIGALRSKISQLAENSGHGADVSRGTLQQLSDVVQRAEQSIGIEAEKLVHAEQDHVTTLPPLGNTRAVTVAPVQQQQQQRQRTHSGHRRRGGRHQRRKALGVMSKSSGDLGVPIAKSLKQDRTYRAIANPESNYNRTAISDVYGDVLAVTVKPKPKPASKPDVTAPKRKLKKKHVGALPSITAKNRMDAQEPPPTITRDDAERGLLSLLERGLIPPATLIDMDPPMVEQKKLTAHRAPAKRPKASVMDEPAASGGGTFVSGIRLRRNVTFPTEPQIDLENFSATDNQANAEGDVTAPSGATGTGRQLLPVAAQSLPQEDLAEAETESLSSFEAPEGVHMFAIVQGVTAKTSTDFTGFRKAYLRRWGSILALLRHFEEVLIKYNVKRVFVDSDKFAALAVEYQLEEKPKPMEYLPCCLNSADVFQCFQFPYQYMDSKRGQQLAAAKIQATWRMYVVRCQWREYRRRKWAASVFCMSWMTRLRRNRLRKQMYDGQVQRLERFYKRQETLRGAWDQLEGKFHKVLHLPSLDYPHGVRHTMSEFNLLQNLQLGRIAGTANPHAELLYVSSMEFSDSMREYSMNMLKAGELHEQRILGQFEWNEKEAEEVEEEMSAAENNKQPDSLPVTPDADSQRRAESRDKTRKHKAGPSDVMFHFSSEITVPRPSPMEGKNDAAGEAAVGDKNAAGQQQTQRQDEDEDVEEPSGPWELKKGTGKNAPGRNAQHAWARLNVIVPSEINTFEMHNLPLGYSLHYSTYTMQRLRHLTMGFSGYLVPNFVGDGDLRVADFLDIPVLSPEPSVASNLSSKSGAWEVFESAKVDCPPGDNNITSEHQLAKSLSRLIVKNPTITRWLVKINDEVKARGIAYLDVVGGNLPSYDWLVREAKRFGDKWSRPWAQETALNRIELEVPDFLALFLTPVSTLIYPDARAFLFAVTERGAIVQATPASSSVTRVTVDMLLTPTGAVEMQCATDQILSAPFHCTGYSLPQTSVKPYTLYKTCQKIGKELCRRKGVMGYCTVDFVASVDEEKDEDILWATDLKFQYSNSMSLACIAMYMSATSFHPKTGCLRLKKAALLPKLKRIATRETIGLVPADDTPLRYVVMSNLLRNSNMVLTRYNVFFQMCKAHHIGFKVEEGVGTLFQLSDSVKRHALGMICIGETLPETLKMFASNLSVIHQEIAPRGRDGRQNFTKMADALHTIIKETATNEEEAEEEQEADSEDAKN